MLLVDATTAEHARGIRTVILGVLGALRESAQEEFTVAVGPGLEKALSPLAVHRIGLASTRPGRLLYQRALLPLDVTRLRRHGESIDRVLLLDSYAPIFRSAGKVRYAALVHDVLPLSHPQYWPLSKRLVKQAAFGSLRRDVSLFTSSEFNAREIELRLGIEARVAEFGCGQLSDVEADSALADVLPERQPYLVYVGALEPRKGVISLIDAFERMIDAGSDLRLILAGDGRTAYRQALLERSGREPVRGRVEIVQGSERSTILDLIAHASVLVMPTHAEGFGLPVLEALALGTPVVASDIAAIRCWADETVSYAPLGKADAWAESISAAALMSDEERRRRQELTRRFRWSRCADELTRF